MLTTITSNKRHNLVSFICPFCGGQDVLHIGMPEACWYCGEKYEFDAEKLRKHPHYRYTYYRYGVT